MLEKITILQLKENIIIKGINTKFWALDTENGTQYKLNELSFDILSSLDGIKTVEQIIEEQSAYYDIQKEILSSDIISFLHIALNKNIIKEVGHK